MGPPSGPLTAGLEAVVVAGALLWLGYGLTGLVPAWREEPVTRWALAFPALVFLFLCQLGVHVVTGGAFFRNPSAVRFSLAALALVLVARWAWRRRRFGARPWSRKPLIVAIGCSAATALVWGMPIFRIVPVSVPGDAGLHAGWTEQLLNGQRLPTASLTGSIPNYYPWLFHAVLAGLSDVTPGHHAYLAYAPMQLLQVAGFAAALFGIGYRYRGLLAGALFTLLGSAAGGFGFFVAGGAHVVSDPRADEGAAATQYLGDLLLVRSYNPSFFDLAPPYPRDLAVSLLAASVFALVCAAVSQRTLDLVAGGVLLGLVGLAQTDAYVVGFVGVLAFALFGAGRGRRLRTAVLVLVPALLVFALWALPIAYWYVRLGGFVNTTVVAPVVLPWWAILGGWGILTPLAVVGVVQAIRRRREPALRLMLALVGASAVVVAGSLVATAIVTGGFETVTREHRYWPLFGVGLALLAAVGAHWLLCLARDHFRPAAWVGAALILALALPSPVLATIAMPSAKEPNLSLTRALEGRPGEVLNTLADYGGGECVAVASDLLRARWTYTGFRFVSLTRRPRIPNVARIRWADIYDRIGSQDARARAYRRIMSGRLTPAGLRKIARRYSLDVLVVPAEIASAEEFRGLPREVGSSEGRRYVVFSLAPC